MHRLHIFQPSIAAEDHRPARKSDGHCGAVGVLQRQCHGRRAFKLSMAKERLGYQRRNGRDLLYAADHFRGQWRSVQGNGQQLQGKRHEQRGNSYGNCRIFSANHYYEPA